MTVADLIATLQGFDPTLEVVIVSASGMGDIDFSPDAPEPQLVTVENKYGEDRFAPRRWTGQGFAEAETPGGRQVLCLSQP